MVGDEWITEQIDGLRNPGPAIIGTRATQPDTAARANALARSLGLPPETVERNLPELQQTDRARQTAATVQSGTPYLRRWYTDPRNAAAAGDDAANLKAISDQLGAFLAKPTAPPKPRTFLQRAWDMAGTDLLAASGIGYANEAARRADYAQDDGWLDRMGAVADRGTRSLQAGLERLQSVLSPWAAGREASAARATKFAQTANTPIGGTTTWQTVKANPSAGNIARFGIEAGVESLPGMAVSALPFGLPIYAASQAGNIGQQRAAANGQRDASARDVMLAAPAAIASAALERLGIEAVFGKIGGRVAGRVVGEGIGRGAARAAVRVGTAAAGEATTEAAQSAVEYAGGAVGTTQGGTLTEALDQMAQGAAAGFFMGGGLRGVHEAGARVGREVRTYAEANRAKAGAVVMDALTQNAQASKLRERDPEAFRSFVAEQAQGTPIENVYIPAEAIRDLMQDGYRDDAFWGDYADQIDEALALDGDVVIPTADVAARLVGTDHWGALQAEARFSPGGMSEAELASLEQAHGEQLDRVQGDIATSIAEATAAAEPAQQVYTQVRDQLSNAGFAPDAADHYAQLWAANRETWASRLGTDALSYHNANPVQFRRILPETLSKVQAADGLDIVINAMRRGKEPATDRQRFGPSLLEFIAARGGIEDRGGDIASMGGAEWHRGAKFRRKLVRPHDDTSEMFAGGDNNNSPDALALAAWEAGYFPEANDRPDVNALLDAMGQELRGTPRYAGSSEASATSEIRTAADELRATISARGLDPDTASPADIKAALKDMQNDPATGARGLDQAPETDAFKRWFGDSKVVDADGKPLVVYHGTGRTFEAFDKSKRGSNTKDADASHGFFFTDSTETAAGYAELLGPNRSGAGPNVVPVFLSIQKPLEVDFAGSEYDPEAFLENISLAQNSGYDGVIFRKVSDGVITGSESSDIYVAFEPTQIKSAVGNSGAFDGSDPRIVAQEARGRALIGDNPGAIIDLFQGSDLSTVIHETGHVWLEEFKRNAGTEGAPDDVKADWQAVQDWFAANGAPVGEDGYIPTEAHELFARSWERYALEGKAPSSALRRAFDAFRGWLLQIYKHVANLRADITPEIRGVFDRMLATEDAINDESERQGIRALFTDAAQAAMTEAEFAAYQQATGEARTEAFDALLYKTMAVIRRERTKAWKEEEARVREETSASINARPEFRALHLLRTGRWLGEPDREGMKAKLDRAWLIETYGADVLSLLPKGVPPLYAGNGMDADTLGDLVGFRNGDDMVRSLMGVERVQGEMRAAGDKRQVRQRMIDEQTAATMTERHGDPLNDGTIEEEAIAAIHNDRQGEVIASELRQLGKRQGAAPTPYRLAREWAARKIAEGKVIDVASRSAVQRYARATAKAARGAETAMLAGDADETFRQKQAQMLNHALLVEAKRAADDVDAAVARLSKIARRATMKSVDQDYLDRAHALLEKFDFRPRTQRALAEQESFAMWAADQQANGIDVVWPPRLEDPGVHYSRMSVEELKGLDASVSQMVHLGRFKQKLIDGKEQRDHDETVNEAIDGAGELRQRPPSDLMEPSWGDRISAGVASADAALLKMETVFGWLDGGRADGVFNRVAFRPIAEAQDRENDMMADYLGRFRQIMAAVPKETLRRWNDRIAPPELTNRETGNPFTFSRQQLVAIALNMGNAGNIQRLTDGYGWSEAGVRAVLERELTAPEWRMAQQTWDLIGGLWPEIAAMEKRVNGIEPEKVEAVKVPTPDGELAGGYYPAVYDSARDVVAERHSGESADLFSSLYTRANTAASATKARADKVSRPLLLDLGVITRHLSETIHDVTHREAIINADKFLSDKRLIEAVDASLGREIRQQFRPWLKFVANRFAIERAGNEGLGKWINKARANATIVGMGFRFSTTMSQIAGYSNSAEYVGPRWIAHGIGAFARSPVASFRFVMDRSGEMRHRMDTLERDIGQQLRELQGRTGALSAAKRFAFHGIGYMDRAVAVPTWIGAYAKAIEAGATEADAAYEGDKAIRLSQGAGSAKDLAAVQRGTGKHGELLKLMTMYYSYVSTVYQRQRTLGRDVAGRNGQPRDLPKLAARAFFLIALPPVLAEILSGRGPKEDEDWGWWTFEKMLAQSLGALPGFRDLVAPIYDTLAGKRAFDFQISPLQSAGQSLVVAAKDARHVAQGEETKHATKDTLTAIGYSTGLVPGQVATSAQFFVDVAQGDQDPETVAEWFRGVRTGKMEEDK